MTSRLVRIPDFCILCLDGGQGERPTVDVGRPNQDEASIFGV
ncbi:MAG: hypothetical protein AAGG65_17835 [Pseudomonadota bacterium]